MALRRGIYRIYQWGTSELPQVLTADEDVVTVSPPIGPPDRDQEWSVEIQDNSCVAIQIPARLFPSRSLSFEGEPEAGKQVILGPVSDFPTREWRVEPALQKPLPIPYFIRVRDKDLFVGISPKKIFPPQLELQESTEDLSRAWVFEFVAPE
ncbi:hypothetical protein CVT25_013023 [Psilocybe cyanescens]|uniref:Uncharacterized protein n=1 Tax=Psilocybe cyanescens TaxID=93625 RepID=A0A409XLX0_PSICY|nr:hypothetical protein CVT25_013023 [Psilocybe cyanescens]